MVNLPVHRLVVSVVWALAVTCSASNRLGRHKQLDRHPPQKPNHNLNHQPPSNHPPNPYPEPGFTLIIPTYKHTHLLEKLLTHLVHPKPPPSLHQIVLVWQNVGVPLPAFLEPAALAQIRHDTGVAVAVRLSQRNSKNEQFRPLRGWGEPILTRAVMLLDDDVVLRKETIEWGWHEFARANPALSRRAPRTGRMVGFQGRDWIHHPHRVAEGEEWEFNSHPEDRVGLVLTSGAWVKTEWLEHYWADSKEMLQLRTYVDRTRDCEDLTFSFVAANLSHTAPLLLQPTHHLRTVAYADREQTSDHFDPFSALVERDATRSHCLAHLFAHFAQFAPPPADPSKPSHFPLKRAHSSVSQDLADHSRPLWEDESWEEEEEGYESNTEPKPLAAVSKVGSGVARVRTPEGVEAVEMKEGGGDQGHPWHQPVDEDQAEAEDDDVDDDDDDDDEEEDGPGDYFNQWESLLSGMTDTEVAELMAELALHHEMHPSEAGDAEVEEVEEEEKEEEEEGEEHRRDEL